MADNACEKCLYSAICLTRGIQELPGFFADLFIKRLDYSSVSVGTSLAMLTKMCNEELEKIPKECPEGGVRVL